MDGAESDGGKVFTIQAKRVPSDPVFVKYKAPDGNDIESDTVKVFNSCEIFSESIRPLSDTSRLNEILSFDIPICRKQYRLEYDNLGF